jgi:hypothetical protein
MISKIDFFNAHIRAMNCLLGLFGLELPMVEE